MSFSSSDLGFHCAGRYISEEVIQRIGARESIVAISYNATNQTDVTTNPIIDVFTQCCRPNQVYRIEGDCILWCDLPENYVDKEGGESFGNACFNPRRWANDTEWTGAIGIWDADFFEGGAATMGGRPSFSVMGALVLATLFVSLLS
jgi:hypothetical protein